MEKVQIGTTVMPETVEAIERLMKVEGKTKGEMLDIVVAAYDAAPKEMDAEILGPESITLPTPKDREMLVDCIMNLLKVAGLHENYVLSGMSLARAEYLRGLPEWKDGERMRSEWAARREAAGRPLSYTQKGAPLK